jgi:hypothetical protein
MSSSRIVDSPALPPAPSPAERGARGPDRAWEMSFINWVARGVERLFGARPQIDPDRLMRRARRQTGLDFVDLSFEEPLRVLAKSLNEEGQLHPLGRIMFSLALKLHLTNRLCLEHAWNRNPDALRQPLNQPLYVVGLPRTGTTLLYNLLCQHPKCRPLMGWESIYPVRNPRRPDLRRWKGRRLVNRLNKFAPRLKSVHEFVSEGPEECTWLLHNTLVAGSFLLQAHVPMYGHYLRDLPHETWRRVYTEYANSLKLLQQDSPDRHWVLKSPAHQVGMAGLLDVIPNACVVQTHRDPLKVIPSCCSLFSVVRGMYSDEVRDETLGEHVLEALNVSYQRAIEASDRHADRVYDVNFEEVVNDPLGVVRAICRRFGYDCGPEMEAGMQRWLKENPQGKHGAHKYDLEQFGLTPERVLEVFGEYRRRYEKA